MMIDNAESINLDLKAKDNYGRSGFKLAKVYKKNDIVDLINKKMQARN